MSERITGANQENVSDVTDALISMITLYTNQLEDYDKAQFTACTSCIGFIGAIIAAIGAILCAQASEVPNSILSSKILPALFLIIPGVITLFLYNFAMCCRRVSLMRGYLQFLEDQANRMLNQNIMQYNTYLMGDVYSEYSVNKYGPIMMALVLAIIFVTSIGSAYYFAFRSGNDWDIILVIYAGFAILCVFMSMLFVRELKKNNDQMEKARKECKQKLSDLIGNEDTDHHL